MDRYFDPAENRLIPEVGRSPISWELCYRCALRQFLPFFIQLNCWHSSIVIKQGVSSAVSVVDTKYLYRFKIPENEIEQVFLAAIKEVKDILSLKQYKHVFKKKVENAGGNEEDLEFTLQQLQFVFPDNLRKRLDMPKTSAHATGVYSVKIQHMKHEDSALDMRSRRRQAGKEYLFRDIQDMLFDGRDYFVTTSIIGGQSEDPFMGDYYEIEIMTLEVYLLSPETCNIDELFIDFKGIFPETNKEPVPVKETPESLTVYNHKGMMFVPLIRNVWRRVA